MAEVVGIVASSISIGELVAQIGSGVLRLKGYWGAVKEAPERIFDLLEEIDDLNSILADVEDDQLRNPISSLLLDNTSESKCLLHCQRAADRLKELAAALGTDLNASSQLNKKWAATKVILKKDKIERYIRKLERSARLLVLAHQCYSRYDCMLSILSI
jgi:hypothetical protein